MRGWRKNKRSSDGCVARTAGRTEGITRAYNRPVPESSRPSQRVGKCIESGRRRLLNEAQIYRRASNRLLESYMVLREDQFDEPFARAVAE